ncbi:hypothetical protein Peetri_00015 [Pseudomonas phage vB_PpuM-Peetri]
MTKKIGNALALLVCMLTLQGQAHADYDTKACNVSFTEEQERILGSAHQVGSPVNFGVTLQAIAWKESFVGDKVVRANPTDGRYGSYGITHVQLSTGAWMLDQKPTKPFRTGLRNDLVTDDSYALQFAAAYLVHTETIAKKITRDGNRQWRATVASYNGSGAQARRYVEDVADKVSYLKSCGLTKTMKRISTPLVAADSTAKKSAKEKLRDRLAEKRSITKEAKALVTEQKASKRANTKSRKVADEPVKTKRARDVLADAGALPRKAPKSVLRNADPLTKEYIQKKTMDIYERALKRAKGDPTIIAWAKGLAVKHVKDPLDQQFMFSVHTLTACCVASGQTKFQTDLDFLNLMLATYMNPSVALVFKNGKFDSALVSKQDAAARMESEDGISVIYSVVV